MKPLLVVFSLLILLSASATDRAPIPDRVVVLTFDDSVASHANYVAPLLKKLGFGATFFITEGFEFNEDKVHYMTWKQIAALDASGFEIGNRLLASVLCLFPEGRDGDGVVGVHAKALGFRESGEALVDLNRGAGFAALGRNGVLRDH